MNVFYTIYALLTSLLFIPLFPLALIYSKITGKYSDHLMERLGWIPAETLAGLQGQPLIWMHAVSLGEVRVADAVIAALKKRIPQCPVLLSTTTKHGRDLAESLDHDNIRVIYFPLDIIFCVRLALARVRPAAMIFIETEIWPTWIFEAGRAGIPTAMINGRISPRSYKSYHRIRPLLKQVLARVNVFSMIQAEDSERIIALGAPPQRVLVNGNAKYERIPAGIRPEAETKMRRILDLPAGTKVLAAGSTRQGEEEKILDAYETILKTFPETILIIAPRHIERAAGIGAMIKQRGHNCDFRTRLKDKDNTRRSKIVIIDTFGELFDTYSTASVVFCGASLVPLGGQNPLEPAAWGKPVLYGPSMEDFQDAREMLEAKGGSIAVSDSGSLAEAAVELFKHPDRLKSMGEKAKSAVFGQQGAADTHAAIIEKLLTRNRGKTENAG
ncbi:MAG: 3-deoxy-D-manno-octulosonic acid transferase [Desulfobacteraceae bacterium]|nr:3-deoxy-D-manno-octulosonic acid transferase [Desulfobacteraceae bacterium]